VGGEYTPPERLEKPGNYLHGSEALAEGRLALQASTFTDANDLGGSSVLPF